MAKGRPTGAAAAAAPTGRGASKLRRLNGRVGGLISSKPAPHRPSMADRGRATWADVDPAERTARMSELARRRWAKAKAEQLRAAVHQLVTAADGRPPAGAGAALAHEFGVSRQRVHQLIQAEIAGIQKRTDSTRAIPGREGAADVVRGDRRRMDQESAGRAKGAS